ncbi:MAG: hypothetical protein MJ180_06285, partial [Candidatus Gastranaerophilales bacterium]|nr:hypothetical protein [Candidatus Gastranaerophilales bacterium]
MKKILFDANFKNNRFMEQMQSAIFKACMKISSDYTFKGLCNEKTLEEFPENVDITRIPFGKFNNIWQNTVI